MHFHLEDSWNPSRYGFAMIKGELEKRIDRPLENESFATTSKKLGKVGMLD